MSTKFFTRFGIALVLALGTAAQAGAQAPPGPAGVILREGTDVPLRFAQSLSSKDAQEGDSVVFTLADNLVVDGMVVAREGAKATGEVTNAKKSGMMGKAGELNIRLEYLKVGDVKVKLRGNKGREGDSKVGTAVALTVLFGPVGLIKHGKNIEIKEGAAIKAYVADDVTMQPVP